MSLALLLIGACDDEGGEPGGDEPVLHDDAGEPTDDEVDAGESAEPSEAASELRVGAAGGELRSADGRVTLNVPKGALQREQTVSIEVIDDALPHQVGSLYRLRPEGVIFAKPVTLTFAYPVDEMGRARPELLRALYRDEKEQLHLVREAKLDQDAHTLSVETTHFSDWSLVEGAQIFPYDARVRVGQAIELKLVTCFAKKDGPDDVVVGNECHKDTSDAAIAALWMVNGEIGGNDDYGTVRERTGNRGTAIYAAPKLRKPPQNPVAVSAKTYDLTLGQLILVSNIDVYDDAAKWSGTITFDAAGSNTIQGGSGFVGSETHTYHSSSTYTVIGVKERVGNRTTLFMRQVSDISYEKSGSMRKEVHEICQAGGPVILRHLFEYQIAGWFGGAIDTEIEGEVYLDEQEGTYSISVDGQDVQLNGQDNIVDKYTHFCDGAVSDNSGVKPRHSAENSGDSWFQGKLDPSAPAALVGGYEKTRSDAYKTRVTVHWNLVHNE